MDSVDNVDTLSADKIEPVTEIDLNDENATTKEACGTKEIAKANDVDATNGTNGYGHSDEETCEETPNGNVDTNVLEERMEKVSLNENEEKAEEETVNERMPQSKSSEFTYTTFEAARSDSEENTVSQCEVADEDVAAGRERAKSEEPVADKFVKAGEGVNSSALAGDVGIDAFLDKVKMDEVNNKDVCNYMLNLLVGGEFDLEKNFIIQNVKSILHLIQVIKCAKQASLKVN